MSVREIIYLRVDCRFEEIAPEVAGALDGRVENGSTVLLPTGALLAGVDGEFGGPLVLRESEWPYRPAGEWEATDAYGIEFRLWQAYGPRVHPATGGDVELAAASREFEYLAQAMHDPMLHIHQSEQLISASHPDHGLHHYAPGTSVFDWDAPAWGPWVWPSPAAPSPG